LFELNPTYTLSKIVAVESHHI